MLWPGAGSMSLQKAFPSQEGTSGTAVLLTAFPQHHPGHRGYFGFQERLQLLSHRELAIAFRMGILCSRVPVVVMGKEASRGVCPKPPQRAVAWNCHQHPSFRSQPGGLRQAHWFPLSVAEEHCLGDGLTCLLFHGAKQERRGSPARHYPPRHLFR